MQELLYGTKKIQYQLYQSARKSMNIEVHPDMSVFVNAPIHKSVEEIEEKLIKKARWIVKQQTYFEQFLPRTPLREYISGETHLYLGKRYVLRAYLSDVNEVKLKGGQLNVYSTKEANPENTKKLLVSWYFTNAKRKFDLEIEESIKRFRKFEIQNPKIEIRRMKNRWGSCTPNGKIILHPELIKAPTKCIQYVIIHELCHLIYPNHSKEFYDLLENKMHDWERWKHKLEIVMR